MNASHACRITLLAAAAALAGVLFAAAAADPLAVGDPAPDFALPGSDGKVHRLSDYRGNHVVLAWFPKAFTGG
jgi:peroxiredoxin Q/BCP